MTKMIRSIFLLILFIGTIALPFIHTADAAEKKVYRVPLHQEVEKGLHAFLQRSFKEAADEGAETIVLDIDTPGGFVDAADQIAKLMTSTDAKIVAFINDRALSAGAFLALYADEIYMTPNGSIGAAQVIDGSGNAAETKANSYWLAQMKNAALHNDRKPKYALAMANPEIDMPELRAPKGELLTLTADEAEKVDYSEGTVATFDELLQKLDLEEATVISTTETFSEKAARFITNPIVVPILLSVASLGLIVELYSPGFGVPGSMGLTALFLFFYGHTVAGLAGYETLILFLLGVGLIIAEFFIAGGIAGIFGVLAIIGSILLAGTNLAFMAVSVLIAMAVASIGAVVIMKFFGKKLHLLNKIILMDTMDTENGYVSNENRTDLLQKVATTLTPLRPSGVADLDGERIDVVSEGRYIDRNKEVVIVAVEGFRIVVREKKNEEEQGL
ncbi:nodulation protein NfeD [Mammaliicoccus sciuri]|uniref:Membrane-bound serine protease (ClpP class) n=2 Tax=Sporosarcina newyorkensis TaxID=759851 RepID=A0A1T4XG21_9BACL|nr:MULTISPECIES: nodulation protein NfeD [Sporosarcina]EGQ27694.1 nodulation efficiency protein D [Sporosarcina newyorkensis 2681]SKA88158.1 membrane-bound serine protease (ClpP class) [Sporosarcina newyorkensis]